MESKIERVKSKNLFNFPPQGFYDEDLKGRLSNMFIKILMDIQCKDIYLIYRASYEGVSADARMGYDPRVIEIQGGPG